MNAPIIPGKTIHLTGKEQRYLQEVLDAGRTVGDGYFTLRCQDLLVALTGSVKALLTPSCTAALEMAALLFEVGPGDEVIMPSFTFSSTAAAFVLRGAVPVFVDIDLRTMNMDSALAEKAVTPLTKAIVPVHYAGTGCDMDAIMGIAGRHNLLVAEDAAQGLMSTRNGKPLGGIGHLGCLSFHESKSIQCGEGGALLINDPLLIERAEILREKGTNRSAFFQGMVDKYTWVDQGSSYLLSELNAAFLLAQLEAAEYITKERLRVCASYRAKLRPLEDAGKITLPAWPAACRPNGHIFHILTSSLNERMALMEHLKKRNILAFFHYVPLHSSPAGLRFGRVCGSLANTDAAFQRLLRLPVHVDMPEEDISRVTDAVHYFYQG